MPTNKEREGALPPIGYEFPLGPYLWRVTYINAGKLRFTAKMVGLIKQNEKVGEPEKR